MVGFEGAFGVGVFEAGFWGVGAGTYLERAAREVVSEVTWAWISLRSLPSPVMRSSRSGILLSRMMGGLARPSP